MSSVNGDIVNIELITVIVAVFDYILILNHPMPLDTKGEKEDFDKLFDNDDEKIVKKHG